MSFSCFDFLATLSVHDSRTIPIKKPSQSDINRENASFQPEAVSSHPIDPTFTNNSSLSISDTSLDRLKKTRLLLRKKSFF